MPACEFGAADEDDFAKVPEILARNGFELRQKGLTDDGYAGARVVEDIFVIVWLGLGVDGNGDGADFDGAKERVEKFGRVEKQEEHALFRKDAEGAKSVAGAVGALEELLIGDALVAAFDGDVLRAAFENVAVHEVGGDVEELRQRDQEATWFAARWRQKLESKRPCKGEALIVYAVRDSVRQFQILLQLCASARRCRRSLSLGGS